MAKRPKRASCSGHGPALRTKGDDAVEARRRQRPPGVDRPQDLGPSRAAHLGGGVCRHPQQHPVVAGRRGAGEQRALGRGVRVLDGLRTDKQRRIAKLHRFIPFKTKSQQRRAPGLSTLHGEPQGACSGVLPYV